MELPEEVVNRIMLFMSHPSAEIIKKEVEKRVNFYLSTLSDYRNYSLNNKAKFNWEVEYLKDMLEDDDDDDEDDE